MTGYGITLTVLPYYVDRVHGLNELGRDSVALHVGTLTGAFSLAQLAVGPVVGRLADRTGRRPVLLGGLASFTASQALFAATSWLPAMYALRVAGGVATSAIVVSATALVADATSPRERASGMAWIGTAAGLGVVAGPALGGVLGSSGLSVAGVIQLDGYAAPFSVAAAVAAVMVPVAWLAIPATNPGGRPDPDAPVGAKESAAAPPWPGLRALLGLVVLSQFGLAVFEGTFVLFGRERMALTAGQAGAAFVVCGAVMAVLQPLVVRGLRRRAPPMAQIAVGLGAMGVGLAALAATTTFASAIAWITVVAAGTALVVPNEAALVSLHGGRRVSTVLGMRSTAGGVGQFAGPVVGGALVGWRTGAPFYSTAAVLSAVAVGLAARLTIRRRTQRGFGARDTR
jgi:DHA1 family multidrug resistance protein-like MFS transporter